MLVITRRHGEAFFIGKDVKVFILEAGGQVRIGIVAPRSIDIVRTELLGAGQKKMRSSCNAGSTRGKAR